MLLLIVNGIYSQENSITKEISEKRIDSAFMKIIRGEEAIEDNKILKVDIKKRDSVIKIQTNTIGIQANDIKLLKENNTSKDLIISNQKVMIKNEIKRGRRKGFFGFLKGVGVGATIMIVLIL